MRNVAACIVLLGGAVPAAAVDWTVDDDGPCDFASIQAAVDAAADGDTITVAAGTYTSSQPGHVVDLRGKAIILRSLDGAAGTVIDGQGARRGIACVSGEGPATRVRL